jgi:hypothetical protein
MGKIKVFEDKEGKHMEIVKTCEKLERSEKL